MLAYRFYTLSKPVSPVVVCAFPTCPGHLYALKIEKDCKYNIRSPFLQVF